MSGTRPTPGCYRNNKKVIVSILEKSLIRETDMPSVVMEAQPDIYYMLETHRIGS